MSITLWNKSLSPICIKELHIVLGNKYCVEIQLRSKHETIDARKVESFSFQYTKLYPEPDVEAFFDWSGVFVKKADGKLIYVKKHIKGKGSKDETLKDLIMVSSRIRTYEGMIVAEDVKYAVILRNKYQKEKTIFVDNKGMTSDRVREYDYLIPPEDLKDVLSLKSHFKSFLAEGADVEVLLIAQ